MEMLNVFNPSHTPKTINEIKILGRQNKNICPYSEATSQFIQLLRMQGLHVSIVNVDDSYTVAESESEEVNNAELKNENVEAAVENSDAIEPNEVEQTSATFKADVEESTEVSEKVEQSTNNEKPIKRGRKPKNEKSVSEKA